MPLQLAPLLHCSHSAMPFVICTMRSKLGPVVIDNSNPSRFVPLYTRKRKSSGVPVHWLADVGVASSCAV
jgi:hypothetical protein